MWRVLAVVCVARAALAEPAKPRTCAAAGGALVEIDQRATGKRTTATTILFANGAWRSQTFDTDHTLADTEQGCLAPDALKTIVNALRAAPWKVMRARPTCALSPRWSTFKWKAHTFTERDCSGITLDTDSARALDLLEAYVPLPALDDASLPRGRHGVSCLENPLAPGCP
jgi:hypothetical protein